MWGVKGMAKHPAVLAAVASGATLLAAAAVVPICRPLWPPCGDMSGSCVRVCSQLLIALSPLSRPNICSTPLLLTCPARHPVPSPCCPCLQAAGFTVSPLMSKYVQLAGGAGPGGESQESLVTLVLMADWGGLLSGGWAGGRAGGGWVGA